MQVRNRYGGIQNMPDRVARELIKAGTVTAVDKPAAEPVTEPVEPKPTRKAKKAE